EVQALPGVSAQVSSVELVPVELASFADGDEDYLRTAPGLFPDLLQPAPANQVRAVPGQWRAAWIDLAAGPEAPAHTGTVRLRLYRQVTDELVADLEVPVHVVDAGLAELS